MPINSKHWQICRQERVFYRCCLAYCKLRYAISRLQLKLLLNKNKARKRTNHNGGFTMSNVEILEAIKGMTILELNDLVKAIEAEFGVTAAAPVAAGGGAAVVVEEEEQSEFDVILLSAGQSKINVIKAVRE